MTLLAIYNQGSSNLCAESAIMEIAHTLAPAVYGCDLAAVEVWTSWFHPNEQFPHAEWDLTNFDNITHGLTAAVAANPSVPFQWQECPTADDCWNAFASGEQVAILVWEGAFAHFVAIDHIDGDNVYVGDSYATESGHPPVYARTKETWAAMINAPQLAGLSAGIAVWLPTSPPEGGVPMGTLELLTPQADGSLLDQQTGMSVKQGFASYLKASDPDLGHVLSGELEFPSQPGNPNVGQCSLQFCEKGILLYTPGGDSKDGLPAGDILPAYAGQVAYGLFQQLQAAQTQVSQLQTALSACQKSTSDANGQAASLQTALTTAQTNLAQQKTAVANLTKQLQAEQQQAQDVPTAQISDLHAQIATLKSELAVAHAQPATPTTDSTAPDTALQAQITTLQGQLTQAQTVNTGLSTKILALKDTLATLTAQEPPAWVISMCKALHLMK